MKVRFTAFNISSMDMNTVMMLRRNRKPATPSANSTALSSRYQESGTPCDISIQLLSGEHDGAEDGDQDQDAGDFEGQQILGEQRAADFERGAALESAEV